MDESPTPTPVPIVLLRMSQVEARVGLKKSAIYKRIQRGQFPRPASLEGRTARWIEAEINAYLAARAAERSDELPGNAVGRDLG